MRSETAGATPRLGLARDEISQAVGVLREGGVIAVPTDTVYGLITSFDNVDGIQRIFDIKGRPADKPLPILLSTAAELPFVTPEVPEVAWKVIGAFWPGALTIILRGHPHLAAPLRNASGGVGVRVPALTEVLDILEAFGLPVASTSANRSGQPAATTAAEVHERLGKNVDLLVPTSGPSISSGMASTVLDLTTAPALIRRRGAIPISGVRSALAARVDYALEA